MSTNITPNQQNLDKNYNQNIYQNQPRLDLYADFLPRSLAWLVDFLILALAKTVLVIFIGLVVIFTNMLAISEAYYDCGFLAMDDISPTTPILREQLLPNEQENCVQTIINLITQISKHLVGLTIVLFTIIQWLYYAVLESSKWQATPGKLILGLKVVDTSFQKISFATASGRYFAKLLSTFCLGIGYLMPLFTERKQTLHDLVTNCVIVRNGVKPIYQ